MVPLASGWPLLSMTASPSGKKIYPALSSKESRKTSFPPFAAFPLVSSYPVDKGKLSAKDGGQKKGNRFCKPSPFWRRHPDLNRGIAVLQTAALPLGYAAMKLERETGFEPATSTLARLHSTAELFPLIFFNGYSKKWASLCQDKTGR